MAVMQDKFLKSVVHSNVKLKPKHIVADVKLKNEETVPATISPSGSIDPGLMNS